MSLKYYDTVLELVENSVSLTPEEKSNFNYNFSTLGDDLSSDLTLDEWLELLIEKPKMKTMFMQDDISIGKKIAPGQTGETFYQNVDHGMADSFATAIAIHIMFIISKRVNSNNFGLGSALGADLCNRYKLPKSYGVYGDRGINGVTIGDMYEEIEQAQNGDNEDNNDFYSLDHNSIYRQNYYSFLKSGYKCLLKDLSKDKLNFEQLQTIWYGMMDLSQVVLKRNQEGMYNSSISDTMEAFFFDFTDTKFQKHMLKKYKINIDATTQTLNDIHIKLDEAQKPVITEADHLAIEQTLSGYLESWGYVDHVIRDILNDDLLDYDDVYQDVNKYFTDHPDNITSVSRYFVVIKDIRAILVKVQEHTGLTEDELSTQIQQYLSWEDLAELTDSYKDALNKINDYVQNGLKNELKEDLSISFDKLKLSHNKIQGQDNNFQPVQSAEEQNSKLTSMPDKNSDE